MFRFLLTLLVLFSACGRPNEEQETQQPLDALRDQYSLYLSLAPGNWSPWDQECDSLLFASLQNTAERRIFDVEKARELPSGQWHRRPDWTACESGPRDSTISRDMFVGLFVYSLNNNRLDLLEQVWDYGVAHNWKMGSDNVELETRTQFTPGMIQLLAKLIAHLGGKRHEVELAIPQIYGSEPGFPSHLTMLHIYMSGKMDGNISSLQLSALKSISEHSPNNPLLRALLGKYTDGDQSRTLELLQLWPRDRLPTDSDWQADWRTQRADGDPSFAPGTDSITHSGGDFLFVAAILLGYI